MIKSLNRLWNYRNGLIRIGIGFVLFYGLGFLQGTHTSFPSEIISIFFGIVGLGVVATGIMLTSLLLIFWGFDEITAYLGYASEIKKAIEIYIKQKNQKERDK